MKKDKTTAFAGPLQEPILKVSPIAILLAAKPGEDARAHLEAEENRVLAQQFTKMFQLLQHFKIPSDSPQRWEMLAWLLAMDFVPGMQVVTTSPRKRGRPPLWKAETGELLLLDVEAILEERRQGVSDAIRILIDRNPRWRQFRGKKAKGLEARYYDARLAKRQQAPERLADLLGFDPAKHDTKNNS